MSEVYTEYIPFSGGEPHKGILQETTTLNYTKSPNPTYVIQFPMLHETLSNAQMDCVVLALDSHEKYIGSGERQGFSIGDGAGVGKGRELAAIIAENYFLNRRKAIWLTCSEALKSSCERDIRDVHGGRLEIDVFDLGGYNKSLPSEGVLFILYTTLAARSSTGSRAEQVYKWLGNDFDGVIILDECHRAKNCAGSDGVVSKVGIEIVELQHKFPNARVVYSSATALSEVRHLGYMTRLGLFGPGCVYENEKNFVSTLKESGVSCMELIGVELKSNGLFLSRVLSLKNIAFSVIQCEKYDKRFYNESALLWMKILQYLYALGLEDPEENKAFSYYWAAHQRFFENITVTYKIDSVVKLAREKTSKKDGEENEIHAVVIGLQKTGESQHPIKSENQIAESFSASRVILQRTALTCCGLILATPRDDKASENQMNVEFEYDEESEFEESWRPDESDCTCLKDQINALFLKLYNRFPPNPIDNLIAQLGGHACVAELTGRKMGYVQDVNGKFHFKQLKIDKNEEIINFQSGKKNIAIITDACSVGISLHDEVESSEPMKYTPLHRKRCHITIQLPWSAVKLVQQLGRSHRSQAMSNPEYVIMLCDISFESRLMSAVNERLRNLGALTQGDQKAGFSSYFSNEIHGHYGRRAIQTVLNKISDDEDYQSMRVALQMVGIVDDSGKTKSGKDVASTFLNRLSGCPVFVQHSVLNNIDFYLGAFIADDKKKGLYDDGIKSLTYGVGSTAEIVDELLFEIKSGNTVLLQTIKISRSMSWGNVNSLLKVNNKKAKPLAYQFYLTKKVEMNPHVLLTFKKRNGTLIVYQPTNCVQTIFGDAKMYDYKFCNEKQAKVEWRKEYISMLEGICNHEYASRKPCKLPYCDEGKSVYNVHVLCGSVISIWQTITKLLDVQSSLIATKVSLSNGTKSVGVLVSRAKLIGIKNSLVKFKNIDDQQPCCSKSII